MRKSEVKRHTLETKIDVILNLDNSEDVSIDTGIKFFDHMLSLMAKHGRLGLSVKCNGDLEVDTHHTVEDVGITLGMAIKEALGDKRSIKRYSNIFTPMDESLSQISLDISGRSYLEYRVQLTREYVGDFETETLEEFLRALTNNAGLTLHINMIYGKNNHHMIESVFKGLGRALREACEIDEDIQGVMSTKGVL